MQIQQWLQFLGDGNSEDPQLYVEGKNKSAENNYPETIRIRKSVENLWFLKLYTNKSQIHYTKLWMFQVFLGFP